MLEITPTIITYLSYCPSSVMKTTGKESVISKNNSASKRLTASIQPQDDKRGRGYISNNLADSIEIQHRSAAKQVKTARQLIAEAYGCLFDFHSRFRCTFSDKRFAVTVSLSARYGHHNIVSIW